MQPMSNERFEQLRSAITIKGVPLKDSSTADVHAEWEGGMYLDSAAGLTPEEEERLIAVERELSNRPKGSNPSGERSCSERESE